MRVTDAIRNRRSIKRFTDRPVAREDIEAVRGMRQAQGDPAPTLLVANEADFSDSLAAGRAGAEGFFLEPLDLPAMESRMHYLVERRRRLP